MSQNGSGYRENSSDPSVSSGSQGSASSASSGFSSPHQDQNAAAMTDPVCGKPVPASSPHTFVFGGALFCFCSSECWAQFLVEPSLYVRLEAPAPRANQRSDVSPADATRAIDEISRREHAPASENVATAARAAAAPPATGTASATSIPTPTTASTPMPNVIAVFEEKHGSNIDTTESQKFTPAAQSVSGASSAAAPTWLMPKENKSVFNRAMGLLATPVALWRQSRHAAAVSRQLMKLHAFISERHPDLKGRALYRQIVMVRTGVDMAAADRMLNQADESFAAWPAERDLTFADVVHYLAIQEFFAAHGETHWTHAHMGRVVAARVPNEL